MRNTKARATYNNLPSGSLDGNIWRRRYVTSYIKFVAGYKNPWTVPDNVAIETMQKIWDAVYRDKIRYTIELNDACFRLVCFF